LHTNQFIDKHTVEFSKIRRATTPPREGSRCELDGRLGAGSPTDWSCFPPLPGDSENFTGRLRGLANRGARRSLRPASPQVNAVQRLLGQQRRRVVRRGTAGQVQHLAELGGQVGEQPLHAAGTVHRQRVQR